MSVTVHTDVGDVKLELHCDQCPKACENFLALCASGYYDNTVIHRNIKEFMVQMGDPTGKGRGGECIWGGKFDDEFVDTLKVRNKAAISYSIVNIVITSATTKSPIIGLNIYDEN